jgi:hypothetical protein
MERQQTIFAEFTGTGLPAGRRPLLLAVLLVVGLVFGAPLFAATVNALGIPLPLPILFGILLVGGVYGVVALVLRRVVLGLSVAVIVTATFAANVPLGTVNIYPGTLGPQLWLLQLPLLALVGVFAIRGTYTRESVTVVELLFGAYVLWSVLSALFGIAPRQDTALYYALYMLNPLLAFGVSYRSIRERVLTFQQMLSVFVITVVGHAAFGIVQFINQAPFGLTFLGETGRGWTTNVINLGPLGEFKIGVLVSGFTGGAGPLSVLLVLAVPLILAFAVRTRSIRRIGTFSLAAVLVFVLRITAKDSARGALILAIVIFVALLAWSQRHVLTNWETIQKRAVEYGLYCLSVVTLFFVTLYPSSRSGTSSKKPVDTSNGSGAPPSDATKVPKGGGQTGAGGLPIEIGQLSIPFLNLSSLGIRMQQYLAGFAIVLDYPLFGVGGANYPYVAPAYGLPAKLHGHLFPLHNMYIAVLAETGIPGFLLYVSALGMVLWSGWCLYRDGQNRTLAAGALSAVVGYLAVSFWIVNTRLVMVVPFWILAGALVAEHRHINGASSDGKNRFSSAQ